MKKLLAITEVHADDAKGVSRAYAPGKMLTVSDEVAAILIQAGSARLGPDQAEEKEASEPNQGAGGTETKPENKTAKGAKPAEKGKAGEGLV